MSTVFIWLCIAMIGILLYIAPMYLAKYTEGNVCIPISCDQQMTHYFTIAIAVYACRHPQLDTILFFQALWHGNCLHQSDVLNDFLKDMMLAITLPQSRWISTQNT